MYKPNVPLITTPPEEPRPLPNVASRDHVHGKLEQSAL